MDKSSADSCFIFLPVNRDNTGKHSGNKNNDNNEEEHKIVV